MKTTLIAAILAALFSMPTFAADTDTAFSDDEAVQHSNHEKRCKGREGSKACRMKH